jgi:sugar lactone lactonase YvrE
MRIFIPIAVTALVGTVFGGDASALYRIDTFAGRGYGDGGPAIAASVISPADATVDSAGRVYFSDRGEQLVRRVDPDGKITTVAGNGSPGFAGDGGPATLANLHDPDGIALDPTEQFLFIVDNGGSRVRRVDLAAGTIVTFAGTGDPAGPFIPNDPTHGIGDGGPAIFATLNQPIGVVVGANGDVYVSERDEGHPAGATHYPRIRRVDHSTGIITLFAGGLPEGYNGEGKPALQTELADPIGMVFDAAGTLYFGELGNSRIRKIGTDGLVTTVAGNGSYPEPNDSALVPFNDGVPATQASLHRPVRLALVPRGCGTSTPCEVYFGDSGHHCVRKVDLQGIVTTVVSAPPNSTTAPPIGDSGDGGPALAARLTTPAAVLGPGNTVLVIDDLANRVRLYDPAAGTIDAFAGTGEGGYGGDLGPAARALLNRPSGLAADAAGDVFVTEHDNHIVRRIAADANHTITTFAGNLQAGGGPNDVAATDTAFEQPTGVTFTPAGDLLVTDAGSETDGNAVRRIDGAGIIHAFAGTGVPGLDGDGGPAPAAMLQTPLRSAVAPNGDVYIADFNNDRIRLVSAASGTITTFAAGLHQPAGLVVAGDGSLYVADFAVERIVRIDAAGVVHPFAGTGVETGTIDGPGGNTADDVGDGGPASGATFSDPTGLALDLDGSLLVADQGNSRIRRIAVAGGGQLSPDSIITTIAGDGRPTFGGDGGNALRASLNRPTEALALPDGRILIADRANERVRVLTPVASLCDVSCDDGDPCTVDTCDPNEGCAHAPSVDTDGDGVCDAEDDCPGTPDPQQDLGTCPTGTPPPGGAACATGAAACIPGNGPAATECLVETVVTGAQGGPVVRCTDNDASCDGDPTPGRCGFSLAWCFNNADPRLHCAASGLRRFALRVGASPRSAARALVAEGLGAVGAVGGAAGRGAVLFQPPLVTANVCTAPMTISLPIRAHGRRQRPGKSVLVATGKAAGRGRDVDTVKLICVPATGS